MFFFFNAIVLFRILKIVFIIVLKYVRITNKYFILLKNESWPKLGTDNNILKMSNKKDTKLTRQMYTYKLNRNEGSFVVNVHHFSLYNLDGYGNS